MIKTAELSGAIITYKDEILMQKRPDNARAFAGMWSIPGGKMEQHEHNNPYAACLREINEETGVVTCDISSINLKYIYMHRYENEIRVMYVYHIDLNIKVQEINTSEGLCRWIKSKEVLSKYSSFGVKEILKHFYENEITSKIYTGTVSLVNSKPVVKWSILDNWTGDN